LFLACSSFQISVSQSSPLGRWFPNPYELWLLHEHLQNPCIHILNFTMSSGWYALLISPDTEIPSILKGCFFYASSWAPQSTYNFPLTESIEVLLY
jgi:hypothetical protein